MRKNTSLSLCVHVNEMPLEQYSGASLYSLSSRSVTAPIGDLHRRNRECVAQLILDISGVCYVICRACFKMDRWSPLSKEGENVALTLVKYKTCFFLLWSFSQPVMISFICYLIPHSLRYCGSHEAIES